MGSGEREMVYVPIAETKLQGDEDRDEQAKPKYTAPDARVMPGVKRAAPLQSHQQADNSADEEESAEEINLLDLLLKRHITVLTLGVLKEEKDGKECDASEWQITIPKDISVSNPINRFRKIEYTHPKTPSPTRTIG